MGWVGSGRRVGLPLSRHPPSPTLAWSHSPPTTRTHHHAHVTDDVYRAIFTDADRTINQSNNRTAHARTRTCARVPAPACVSRRRRNSSVWPLWYRCVASLGSPRQASPPQVASLHRDSVIPGVCVLVGVHERIHGGGLCYRGGCVREIVTGSDVSGVGCRGITSVLYSTQGPYRGKQ